MARLDTPPYEVEVDLETGRQDSPGPASPSSTSSNKSNKSSSQGNNKQKQTRAGRRCCRVACAALLAAAVVAALLGGALYLALDPKLPRYSVDALSVTGFGMDDDMTTVRARLDASVRFENPNRAIGIRYEEGSDLSVWFGGYRLSRGALPAFYQGHGDAAVVRVAMSELRLQGTGVVELMRRVREVDGELPLVFRGEVPVRVKVGPFTTAKLTPSVRCDLVLNGNSLATDGSLGVKSMDCKLSIKLW